MILSPTVSMAEAGFSSAVQGTPLIRGWGGAFFAKPCELTKAVTTHRTPRNVN